MVGRRENGRALALGLLGGTGIKNGTRSTVMELLELRGLL